MSLWKKDQLDQNTVTNTPLRRTAIFMTKLETYDAITLRGGLIPPVRPCHSPVVVFIHHFGGHKPPVCLPPPQILMWWNTSTIVVDVFHQCFYSVQLRPLVYSYETEGACCWLLLNHTRYTCQFSHVYKHTAFMHYTQHTVL